MMYIFYIFLSTQLLHSAVPQLTSFISKQAIAAKYSRKYADLQSGLLQLVLGHDMIAPIKLQINSLERLALKHKFSLHQLDSQTSLYHHVSLSRFNESAVSPSASVNIVWQKCVFFAWSVTEMGETAASNLIVCHLSACHSYYEVRN